MATRKEIEDLKARSRKLLLEAPTLSEISAEHFKERARFYVEWKNKFFSPLWKIFLECEVYQRPYRHMWE